MIWSVKVTYFDIELFFFYFDKNIEIISEKRKKYKKGQTKFTKQIKLVGTH